MKTQSTALSHYPGNIQAAPDPLYKKGCLVRTTNGPCPGFTIAACDYVPNSAAMPINDTLEGNAERIAATWNACTGVANPQPGSLAVATNALLAIFAVPGNLKDEVLESKTGANDAAARGIMVTGMRAIANEALEKMKAGSSDAVTIDYKAILEDMKAQLTAVLEASSIKKGSVKARHAEVAFIYGAQAARPELRGYAYLNICLMSGRSILD